VSTAPDIRPVRRLLVANRGEIARRVMRTCRALGIDTVAVYSDPDADAPFVSDADHAIRLPGRTSAETYLQGELIVAAAVRLGADAIHPGYGFLSENAEFARRVIDAGLIWVGPPPDAIAAMGSKIEAKRLMRSHGVPIAPDNSVETLDEVGLPALVKASAGGGGRGMRIVRSADELAEAIASAEREAEAAFGDGTVFVERYLEHARHVEIQVLADQHGSTVSLFERDCTVQRRHQKVLEESPSPAVHPDLRTRMGEAAVAAARAVGYVGAGTVEFLLGADGNFSFLEMNTRLQVEHPVTELVTGLDLVALQIAVAEGRQLNDEVHAATQRGHAIEARLCAEDPARGYLPSSGRFHVVEWAQVDGVRIDSAIESGTEVPPFYDSMVAKVIAHGADRADAARRLVHVLRRSVLVGPVTNRDLLMRLLERSIEGTDGDIDTGWLDRLDLTPDTPNLPLDVAAAALAVAAARRAPNAFPIGWRNNPSQLHRQRVGEHVVDYRYDRNDMLERLVVDDDEIDLDDGIRDALARVDTHVIGDTVWVHSGRVQFAVPADFPLPDDAGRAGSTVSPMPGTLRRVLVAVGDEVTAGQPLVVLEAMKMEHQVVAPTAGTVSAVLVTEGQQLDGGQPLVQVDPA